MTCDAFRELASEFIDGTLDAARQGEAEAHVAGCVACRCLADDLREVRSAAARLERPPAPGWASVAARLHADAEFARAASTAHGRTRRVLARLAPHSWAGLAVAATLVLAIGAAIVSLARQAAQPAAPAVTAPANASPGDLVESIESDLAAAAMHYERAIASLEQVASASDSPLDPALTATLRRNLGLIDQAIEESRAALRADPGSRMAQDSLFEAFRKKVALLQDTIALMNELRKGDPAGAARVVEDLNKS